MLNLAVTKSKKKINAYHSQEMFYSRISELKIRGVRYTRLIRGVRYTRLITLVLLNLVGERTLYFLFGT